MNCCYCTKTFDVVDLRPYGPNGDRCCFDCAMLPENEERTKQMFHEAVDRAMSMGTGAVYLGSSEGPLPVPPGENN